MIRSGLSPRTGRAPLHTMPQPWCWSAADGKVTFSTATGHSFNLWQLEVSQQTGHVAGSPQRLTTGGGSHLRASCGDRDTVVFSQIDVRSDIWSLPVSLNLGTVTGTPQRIIRALREAYPSPSLSEDGRYMTFASDRSGQANIWLHDFGAQTETSVAASPFVQRYPVSNASGDAVAFSVYENDTRAVYVSARGGVPDKVCDGCLRATDWSQDQKSLVIFGGSPYHINLLDVASHRQTPLLQHAEADVLYGRLSPDYRWLSFTLRVQPARGRIMIAPIDGPRPVPERAWMTVADVEADDYANWSPDGRTLYFTSGKDGYSCVWGQRLDSGSRRPVGEPFAVQHFHGRQSYEHLGWAAAADRIVVPLDEITGDLWMMTRSVR